MSEPPPIFDRALLRYRRNKIAANGERVDYLLDRVAGDLCERLSAVNRTFNTGLDLGCHHGVVGSKVALLPSVASIISLDGSEHMLRGVAIPKLVGDEEALPFAPESFDLIFSGLSMHWVNDLPGCFIQIRRCLMPDGLFIAAILGSGSLVELRNSFFCAEDALYGGASARVSPFGDVRDFGNLLQRAGFALPVADREVVRVRYSSPLQLMYELKAMGASNVLSNRLTRLTSRRLINLVNDNYLQNYRDDDGKVFATFEIIYLMGWAPHLSQQKPLRPGSGKMHFSKIFK